LKDQQASQTLNVKLQNIKPGGSTVGKLVDALTNIDGINLFGVSFNIDNDIIEQTSWATRLSGCQDSRLNNMYS
jgi:hypothetical protein